MQLKITLAMLILLFGTVAFSAKKKKITYNDASYGTSNKGTNLLITFDEGKSYNHPLYAIWLADEGGNYLQALYVSQSVGKGVYLRTHLSNRIWMPGESMRPATLPYWVHQRNVQNENGGLLPTAKNPVIDAYTGATIKNSFRLNVKTDKVLVGKYKIFFEINQSWDWNEYWHNNKYPNDKEYKTSSQPALVYYAEINTTTPEQSVDFKAIGHSHYAGTDGSLTTDLSTLTTALDIASKITVRVEK